MTYEKSSEKDIRIGDTVRFNENWYAFLGRKAEVLDVTQTRPNHRMAMLKLDDGPPSFWDFHYIDRVSTRMMLPDPLFSLEELTDG